MKKRASRRAFTLIEVVLALAVLVLLAGGIFGTVRGTVAATAALRDAERQREGVYGMFALCARTFPALPAEAALALLPGRDGVPELDFQNAPGAFALDGAPFPDGTVAVAAHRLRDGTLTLGVEYRPSGRGEARWLPLLPGLDRLEWAFSNGGAWQQALPGGRPALVRLTLWPAGANRPWTRTFELEKVAPAPAPPLL